jgi:hypothetical protein
MAPRPGGTALGSGTDLLGALLAASYRPTPVGTGVMRHGTEGWKCLETSMRALAAMMEGAGPGVRPEMDEELRELLYRWGGWRLAVGGSWRLAVGRCLVGGWVLSWVTCDPIKQVQSVQWGKAACP